MAWHVKPADLVTARREWKAGHTLRVRMWLLQQLSLCNVPCTVGRFSPASRALMCAVQDESNLWFEVSVHHHVPVTVLHPADDLLEVPAGLVLQ